MKKIEKTLEELQYYADLEKYKQQKKVAKFFNGLNPEPPIHPFRKKQLEEQREHQERMQRIEQQIINSLERIVDRLDERGINYNIDADKLVLKVPKYFRYEILNQQFYYSTTPRTPRYYSLQAMLDIIDNISLGKVGGRNAQKFQPIMTEEEAIKRAELFYKENQLKYELSINKSTIKNYCLTATLDTGGMWKVDFWGQFKTYFMDDKDLIVALDKNLPE